MNDSGGGQAGVPPARGPGGAADAAERRRGWQDERAGSLGTGSAYRPAVRPRAARGAATEPAWVPRSDGRSARPAAPAVRLLTSCAAAPAVWFLGALVTARLTPSPGVGGVPVSELRDALRVHVPCLVTSVLCVVVAGFIKGGLVVDAKRQIMIEAPRTGLRVRFADYAGRDPSGFGRPYDDSK
ncbi:hypothetical protein [Actinomadura sp. SCN-SB]|uniref:hypothetical protein n=1 Tax=Actinomadura sp. SCN-SB TaxID=3373092 RepID=UPI003753D64B